MNYIHEKSENTCSTIESTTEFGNMVYEEITITEFPKTTGVLGNFIEMFANYFTFAICVQI